MNAIPEKVYSYLTENHFLRIMWELCNVIL